MKKELKGGFDALLTPNPQENTQPATEKQKKEYKTVCYSINPATAEKIRIIAKWDRKKINEVVTEAFEQYARDWKPSNEKPPRL